jgi:hypothetical protein
MDNHITLKIKELVNIINNRVALKPYANDMNKPVGFVYLSTDIRGQSTQIVQNMNESPDIQSLFDSMFPPIQREINKNNSIHLNKKSYKLVKQKKKRVKRKVNEEIETEEINNKIPYDEYEETSDSDY